MIATHPHPRSVIDGWISAVNAHDFKAVAQLYAPNAVLLPTFSNRILYDESG